MIFLSTVRRSKINHLHVCLVLEHLWDTGIQADIDKYKFYIQEI